MVSLDLIVGLDMFDVVRWAKELEGKGWRILGELNCALRESKPTIFFVVVCGVT